MTNQSHATDNAKPLDRMPVTLSPRQSALCTRSNAEFLEGLRRAEADLLALLEASKGGQIRGITEDHRYEFGKQLGEVRALIIAKAEGRALSDVHSDDRHPVAGNVKAGA